MKKLCTKLVSPQINDVKWKYLVLNKSGAGLDITQAFPMEQYGKTIKVYYNEEWYNKYLYFFPYYKSVDINLYSLWHIEQPVSLKFNGEKLQIIEENNIIEEYEARSGIAVKKRADTSNNTQEVPYPLEPLDKYFYCDEQSTSKILEGEYYIIEEALEANSAELVGELYSGLYKNSLGSRYMDLYKSSDVSFINIAHFNQMILERKNYFFKSDTLNKIHGGIDYEDKGGIDLSTGADEFFKDLTKIIKDKSLYKVSGKIPIKLEVKYIKDWHDPLDKMEICLFSQGGHYKPWNASFGETRENIPEGEKDYAPRDHTGVDLFAPIGMPVYACLDGVYHIVGKKYGTAYLVVDKDEIETLKNMYNKNYKIIYNYAGNPYNYNVKTLKGELLFGSQFNINSPNFVIRYQHLSSFESKLNGKYVKRGTIIGRTGITGAGDNNYGPHLHFEIGNSAGTGLNDKANPVAFVNIKFPENVFTKDTLVKLKGGKSNADLMNDVNYLKLIYPYFKEQVEYLLKIAKRNDLLLKITGGSV
ncbi:M23 family metallopeptidase [Mucispirillum schaedleri]|uniref:M23 family metallopeptidase n=1 Tax=Mucispirillum schaedleri TaxID=248039 RepID=UPI001F56C08C|nr:M23 family metallopeptidase [Mucispirillum schaedleri]